MNAPVATTGGQKALATSAEELMAKMVERAKHAVKEAFLDSLTDEQYQHFVAQAMDEFLYGPPEKRFKWVRQDRPRYLKSADELGDELRLAQGWKQDWDGPKEYSVEARCLNEAYNAANDPGTFPGMLRSMLQDYAKESFLKDIESNPKMQTTMQSVQTADGFTTSFQYFEKFMEEFLVKNMVTIMHAQWGMMLSNTVGRVMTDLRNGVSRPYG
jgi:hypothetical protein